MSTLASLVGSLLPISRFRVAILFTPIRSRDPYPKNTHTFVRPDADKTGTSFLMTGGRLENRHDPLYLLRVVELLLGALSLLQLKPEKLGA
jgi:hypothetical protein